MMFFRVITPTNLFVDTSSQPAGGQVRFWDKADKSRHLLFFAGVDGAITPAPPHSADASPLRRRFLRSLRRPGACWG